jgi:3-hydroxybutyryl-CoA dehydratase
MRFYDDYKVGETFHTDSRRVTAEEVDRFVEYVGVRNPLFLDAQHASKGPFQNRIIPGFLTQSLALGLLYQPQIIQYFLLTEAHTRFLKPVKVDDSIHVDGKITQKKTTRKSKAGLLTLETEIHNQKSERVAEMELVISVLKQAYAP